MVTIQKYCYRYNEIICRGNGLPMILAAPNSLFQQPANQNWPKKASMEV